MKPVREAKARSRAVVPLKKKTNSKYKIKFAWQRLVLKILTKDHQKQLRNLDETRKRVDETDRHNFPNISSFYALHAKNA
jgi:hypothetical protein